MHTLLYPSFAIWRCDGCPAFVTALPKYFDKNRATGVVRSVMADEAGLYSAPNLQAGGYDVTATQPGFSTVAQSNITLTVGAQQQLNITMKVGETAQVIEVTEAAPMVQVTSSL